MIHNKVIETISMNAREIVNPKFQRDVLQKATEMTLEFSVF